MKSKITYLFLFVAVFAFAQPFTPNEDTTQKNKSEKYTVVEVMPEYPGGRAEMMKFLQQNIKYPKKEMNNGIQGKVFVRFIIEQDGSIGEPEVLKGVVEGEALSEEALRVVKLMPKWNVGTQNGKPVRVLMNLPINFQLSDSKEKKQEKK